MQPFATPPRITRETTTGGVGDMPDQRLRDLALYWAARRDPASGVPPRSAIDPLDFPALLPNIMLLDRIGMPPEERYRFRLAGTDVVHHAGRELTGRHIDEMLPDPYHDYVRLMNRLALEKRQPVYSSGLYHDQGNFVNGITYRLIMPVATAATADMIFVCQFWQRRQDDGHWRGDWRSAVPEIRLISLPADSA